MLDTLFEASRDCMKVLTLDGRLVAMNRSGQIGMEIEDFDAIRGAVWSSLWPKESRHLVSEAVARALAGESSKFTAPCPTPKGSPRWWEVEVMPIFDNEHRVTAILSASYNVTKWIESHRDMSDALQRTRDTLAARERTLINLVEQLADESTRFAETQQALAHSEKLQALGEFIGVVVHDLNNVLSIADSSLRVLRRVAADRFAMEILDQGSSAIQRGVKLVRLLLDYSRLEEIEPDLIEPLTALKEIGELVSTLVGGSIKVDLECASDCWPIMVSRAKLEAVFLNLAANARDAMPKGGRLLLKAENVPSTIRPARLKEDDYVRLEIKDDGCGMSPEILAKVGKPFFTTKAKGVGTGLGIASAFKLAEAAHGRAKVVSAPGKGTSIVLYFPRCISTEASAPSETMRDHGAATIVFMHTGGNETSALARFLKNLNYTVVEVFDAEEARRVLLEPLRVDLIVLNRELTDFRSFIRDMRYSAPVLLLAEQGTSGLEPLAAVITKPIDKAQFAAKILQVLERVPAEQLTAATMQRIDALTESLPAGDMRGRLSRWRDMAGKNTRVPELSEASALSEGANDRFYLIHLSGDVEFPALLYESVGAMIAEKLGAEHGSTFFEPSHRAAVGPLYQAYEMALKGLPCHEVDIRSSSEWLMLPFSSDRRHTTHLLALFCFR
jgi:PAS domain S-box-containing protein